MDVNINEVIHELGTNIANMTVTNAKLQVAIRQQQQQIEELQQQLQNNNNENE